MSDGTGIENIVWLVDRKREQPMTRDQLIERIEEVGLKAITAWDEFGPEAVMTARKRYGRYVIVVGVEFAKEDEDE
jgi:hypothetical protein